jgi:hypothetical protein
MVKVELPRASWYVIQMVLSYNKMDVCDALVDEIQAQLDEQEY